MSITFHCEHCGHKISAKEESVGKWGKCPSCHNKIYVPDLNADIDDLKLAPLDEESEARQKELMSETHRLTWHILSEREATKAAGPAVPSVSYPIDEKTLQARIISYLRSMADGKLKEAEKLQSQISPYKEKALKILDKIALSEIPEAELANIRPAVLGGMIKDLRSKISESE